MEGSVRGSPEVWCCAVKISSPVSSISLLKSSKEIMTNYKGL